MKLTTKGRYAVMAMADLAMFKDKGPISLTDISLRQNISLAYLEQIFISSGGRSSIYPPLAPLTLLTRLFFLSLINICSK